jgi:hypothetical protein
MGVREMKEKHFMFPTREMGAKTQNGACVVWISPQRLTKEHPASTCPDGGPQGKRDR